MSAAASLTWRREERATWDADVARVVGSAPPGVFDLDATDGARLPGDWWSARDEDDRVLGYGWLDVEWGDAEVLLAVDPARSGRGVGAFVLAHLEQEAAARGVNYVYNTVPAVHPEHGQVSAWLEAHGYRAGESDELRKRVATGPATAAATRGTEPAPHPSRAAPTFDAATDRGPGDEASGGYVDPEHHQY